MELASLGHEPGQKCPAYGYCKALEARGMVSLGEVACIFDRQSPALSLADDTICAMAKGDESGIEGELIAAARDSLGAHLTDTDEDRLIQRVAARYDDVFAARIVLWRSMIDAARSDREFTDVELAYLIRGIDDAKERVAQETRNVNRTTAVAARAVHDRRMMEAYGLQFDEAMIADIDHIVGNLIHSRPTLVVGDKGIAKTQVAKFVMGLYGYGPIVISVKGDMMSDELIGRLRHDRELNTFVFQDGALLQAMRQGLPILLDEINFGDQAIIARLQDILLKKPGEQVFVQESSETLSVAPGFAVLATANEASTRYRHREVLDPAIRDRFDIVMRGYPDRDIDPLTEPSGTLLRMALAAVIDDWGHPSKHVSMSVLERFIALAHLTQHLYSTPGTDVVLKLTDEGAKSSTLNEDEAPMTDCITPRTVESVLSACAAGNMPGMHMDAALIERLARSLDQAGSTHNYDLAAKATTLMGFDADAGGVPTRDGAEDHALSQDAITALLA